jgi:transcriptional regulator with XRE-family HTH domain
MNNPQQIANLIKQSAKEKSISIKQLLEKCELNINTISELSKGKQISYLNFARIADCLDCSVDYLLGRTDDPAPKNYINGNNNIQAINNGKNFTVNTTTKSNDLIEDFMKIFDGLSSENKIKLMYSAIELKNKGE